MRQLIEIEGARDGKSLQKWGVRVSNLAMKWPRWLCMSCTLTSSINPFITENKAVSVKIVL